MNFFLMYSKIKMRVALIWEYGITLKSSIHITLYPYIHISLFPFKVD
jgi:hypothetical protein